MRGIGVVNTSGMIPDQEVSSDCHDWIANLNTCLCYCCPTVGINHPSRVNRLTFIQGIRNLWVFIRTGNYKITQDELNPQNAHMGCEHHDAAPVIQPSLSMDVIEQDSPSTIQLNTLEASNMSNMKYSLKELSNLKFV